MGGAVNIPTLENIATRLMGTTTHAAQWEAFAEELQREAKRSEVVIVRIALHHTSMAARRVAERIRASHQVRG